MPALICGFCVQNNDFKTRITSLYVSQTSTMFFFAFKTSPLAPELQDSMDPYAHLWFCAFTTASLGPELQVSMGPRLRLLICE